MKHEVPDNGNSLIPQNEWTAFEQQLLDGNLKAFARWEVDYTRREVRSTRCQRLTANTSKICEACEAVARDESFKDAVRRVSIDCRST